VIRAVVFDCFGVLASDGWLPYKAKYFGDDPALRGRASELTDQVDAGAITLDQFISQVASLAGMPEETTRQQIENNIPDEAVFTLIRRLKQNYLIGLLSNAGDDWLAEIFTSDQVVLFDAVALSYEMKCLKPQALAYATIAKRLGAQVSECVFIDDQPRHVEGAQQAGMTALLYANADQLQIDLQELGLLAHA
jgi:HAD superfamily hydrolase (TIGR01509 family)